MDLASLSNRRLAKRGMRIGRLIRIANQDESVGVLYVRHISESVISKSSFARNIQQQRAQPIRSNARTGHCVRAFALRHGTEPRAKKADIAVRARSA